MTQTANSKPPCCKAEGCALVTFTILVTLGIAFFYPYLQHEPKFAVSHFLFSQVLKLGAKLLIWRPQWLQNLRIQQQQQVVPSHVHDVKISNFANHSYLFTWNGNNKNDKMIMFVHGGGWILGDTFSYLPILNSMVRQVQVPIVSIDYPLAPEHPFPIGLHFVVQQYLQLRKQYGKIACAGDSAGGNLCAALSLYLRDTRQQQLDGQILLYPVLANSTLRATFASHREYGRYGYVLDSSNMHELQQMYTQGNDSLLNDAYVFPLAAKSLQQLPKTLLITAQHDILRDEGLAFLQRLHDEQQSVQHASITSYHGYLANIDNAEEIEQTHTMMKQFMQQL